MKSPNNFVRRLSLAACQLNDIVFTNYDPRVCWRMRIRDATCCKASNDDHRFIIIAFHRFPRLVGDVLTTRVTTGDDDDKRAIASIARSLYA